MKLIAFSKHFKERTPDELAQLGTHMGLDGWDLCVRPGYPVNPENVSTELARAAKLMNDAGLCIPMVTGDFDLLYSDNPTAGPIMAAMDKSGICLLKLGYYKYDPLKDDYWAMVDDIRRSFDGWAKLARQFNVKVCCHTHSNRYMGMNCGMLAHLLAGFDPVYIGAYIDPGHLLVDGEEFAVGLGIIGKWLSLVALKDVLLLRQVRNTHGSKAVNWVQAGNGMVDWTAVFSDLARIGYDGPMSIHCEFAEPDDPLFLDKARAEIAFFRKMAIKFYPLKK